MNVKTATVYGTLMYEGKDFLSLCQMPIKLADKNGHPLDLDGFHSFLVVKDTPSFRESHPKHEYHFVDVYDSPFVLTVEKGNYAFIFDDPHEIVCVDNQVQKGEDEEPLDFHLVWSAEDVLTYE